MTKLRIGMVTACLLTAAAGLAENKKPLPWLGLAFTWSEVGENTHMLHVRSVTAGGPAEKAGVRAGDLIATIQSERVDFGDELEFLLFLRDRTPGERLRLGVVRHGKTVPITVTLGTLAEEQRAKWERNLGMARRKREERLAKTRRD